MPRSERSRSGVLYESNATNAPKATITKMIRINLQYLKQFNNIFTYFDYNHENYVNTLSHP